MGSAALFDAATAGAAFWAHTNGVATVAPRPVSISAANVLGTRMEENLLSCLAQGHFLMLAPALFPATCPSVQLPPISQGGCGCGGLFAAGREGSRKNANNRRPSWFPHRPAR